MEHLGIYEIGLYVAISQFKFENIDEIISHYKDEKRNTVISGLQNLWRANYIELTIPDYKKIKIIRSVL